MADTDEFRRGLTSDKLAGIHAAWNELSGGRIGPRREEVRPARLRSAMPWVFLIDVVGSDFRFSFAGERIVEFMGRRLAGELLSAHLGTPFYDGMNRFFARCVTTGQPVSAAPRRASYPGKEHLELEAMVLPLSDDGKTVTSLIGAFDTWQAGTHTSRL